MRDARRALGHRPRGVRSRTRRSRGCAPGGRRRRDRRARARRARPRVGGRRARHRSGRYTARSCSAPIASRSTAAACCASRPTGTPVAQRVVRHVVRRRRAMVAVGRWRSVRASSGSPSPCGANLDDGRSVRWSRLAVGTGAVGAGRRSRRPRACANVDPGPSRVPARIADPECDRLGRGAAPRSARMRASGNRSEQEERAMSESPERVGGPGGRATAALGGPHRRRDARVRGRRAHGRQRCSPTTGTAAARRSSTRRARSHRTSCSPPR